MSKICPLTGDVVVSQECVDCDDRRECSTHKLSPSNVCPKCGKRYNARPAMSRLDSSPICPQCGTKEALEDAGIRGKTRKTS